MLHNRAMLPAMLTMAALLLVPGMSFATTVNDTVQNNTGPLTSTYTDTFDLTSQLTGTPIDATATFTFSPSAEPNTTTLAGWNNAGSYDNYYYVSSPPDASADITFSQGSNGSGTAPIYQGTYVDDGWTDCSPGAPCGIHNWLRTDTSGNFTVTIALNSADLASLASTRMASYAITPANEPSLLSSTLTVDYTSAANTGSSTGVPAPGALSLLGLGLLGAGLFRRRVAR